MQKRMRKAVLLGLAGGISWAAVNYSLDKHISVSFVGGASWFLFTIVVSFFSQKINQT
ncbi:hypothetical protein HZF08_35955 [Paenibacillus sp. CGMCC 1.16610]|uniref:Uncharacterized protein n=1 Tax=Paenibacillus anseongense TaxID=2682845 RepID=A0ABW9UCD8_9BACL|nr:MULTISPECIES: hypothetical protein [Paenibacillus]MBA2943672.1 hypothetical protein [Paenibacillus sp. CGMCC 1.16610]MVQ37578.1 hypothetical protein [Paenibacillus anseongense]